MVENFSNRNTNTIRVIATLFADNSNSEYVGRYPIPANRKSDEGGYNSIKYGIVNPDKKATDAIYKAPKPDDSDDDET
jgi:hypothetical protein